MDWANLYLKVDGTAIATSLSSASKPHGQNFGKGNTATPANPCRFLLTPVRGFPNAIPNNPAREWASLKQCADRGRPVFNETKLEADYPSR